MKKAKGKLDAFASDAMYNTLGNMVYFFCLWIITILVVRLSDYENAGILSVAMTTSNIFFVIANYGMRSFQASDINIEYTNRQYLFSRYVTVTIGTISCLLFAKISGYDGEHFEAILFFMLYKALEAFSDVLFGIMQRGHRLKTAGISLIAKGVLSVVAFVIGMLITNEMSFALLLMFLTSLLTVLLYDIPQTLRVDVSIFRFKKEDIKLCFFLLKACFAMFLVSVAPMILQAIPKLSFEKMYSAAELGIYSSVSAPTVVLSTLVSCIMIPFLPQFASAIYNEDRKKLLRLLLSFVIAVISLGALASIAAVCFGGFALSILYGDELHNYNMLLMYSICSVTLTGLLYCFNALFISGRKIPLLAAIYIVADFICYLISPSLITSRGIYGITDSLLITQLLQCTVLILLSIRLFFKVKRRV